MIIINNCPNDMMIFIDVYIFNEIKLTGNLSFMLIANPKGFFNTVGELCSFCRRLNNKIITNTNNKSNVTAVRTPIKTSTYSLPSSLAVTERKYD